MQPFKAYSILDILVGFIIAAAFSAAMYVSNPQNVSFLSSLPLTLKSH